MTKPNGRHSQESVGTIKTVSVLRDFAKLVWIGSLRFPCSNRFVNTLWKQEHIHMYISYTHQTQEDLKNILYSNNYSIKTDR